MTEVSQKHENKIEIVCESYAKNPEKTIPPTYLIYIPVKPTISIFFKAFQQIKVLEKCAFFHSKPNLID